MADKNKNKGSGEFDEGFDDEFSDVNFDDISFEDNTAFDETGDDSDYEGDDFESEDWGDAGDESKPAKKAKKQKSGGGGGLGFNTIVIIGAVVLGGGVLAFNVMRETNKAASAKPAMFQSILGIGGIMDGMLFGEKEETAPEETAQDQGKGFLNDPNMPIPATPQDSATPPQPAPISPADSTAAVNEPLTPMPAMPSEPSAEAPRGPEDLPVTEDTLPTDTTPSESVALTPAADVPPAETPETGTPESASSAEDILKQAMANREQKQEENTETPSPLTDKEALEEALQEKMADAKERTEEVAAGVKEKVKDAAEPSANTADEAPPAAEPVAPVADVPPPTASATESNEAVTALSEKLDTLLERIDQIESDLDTLREDKSANAEEIEKTVAALKEDVAAIKDRPVAAPRESSGTGDVEETPKPASVKKKKASKPAAPEDEAYSPSTPVAATAPAAVKAPVQQESSGHWELRAAQPGRAWVSKPGERDMQAVAVGENLAGIGRITAIIYQNGRWTVTGTQGAIQQ